MWIIFCKKKKEGEHFSFEESKHMNFPSFKFHLKAFSSRWFFLLERDFRVNKNIFLKSDFLASKLISGKACIHL